MSVKGNMALDAAERDGPGSGAAVLRGRNASIRAFAVVIAFLWALFMALDVLAYLSGQVSPYTIYLKGVASFLCAAVSWLAWKEAGRRPADLLRALGFSLAFLGDVAVLLNTYRILSAPMVFAVGGYLFVPALLLIATRNAGLFTFLFQAGKLKPKEAAFALAFYLPFAVLVAALGKSLASVGLLGLGIAYGTCLVTVLWTGWAAFRNKAHAAPRGLMIALGASLVFVMELIGLIYNLNVPGLSEIAFFATWILYVPGMLLLALA